jgi:hypothetical protein
MIRPSIAFPSIKTSSKKPKGLEEKTLLKPEATSKANGENGEHSNYGSTHYFTPKPSPSSSATTASQSPSTVSPPDSPKSEDKDTKPSSSSANGALLILPPDDAADDRSHEDPYVYSDDSGSLSDSYFFPQHDSMTALAPDTDDSDRKQAALYGSLGHRHHSFKQLSVPSRISLNGILEDAPVTNQVTPLVSTDGMRKYRKKRQQRHQLRKKLQEQRERAVAQIRGKPQPPTTYHDLFWLFLFVLQLLLVFLFAIRYGWTLMQPTPLLQDVLFISSSNAGADLVVLPGSINNNYNNRTSTNTPKPIQFNTTKTNTPKNLKPLQDDDSFLPEKPTSAGKSSPFPKSTTASATTTPTTSSASTNSEQTQPAPFSIDKKNIFKLFTISGIYACVTSYLSIGFMLIVARSLIPIMLVFTILLALCWGVFGLTVFPYGFISFFGFSFLILSLGYALVCWNRIPFCSTNLYTAICALRHTTGILLVGIGSLWISFLWCLVWAIAVMGIFNMDNSVDCQLQSDCEAQVAGDHTWELAILIVSFYWTNMVIKNVVRVTVAGAIGAWWFAAPREAHCCCDSTVWGPLVRACSNSLGSVCLGSLLVLPAQTISVLGSCCCWVIGGGNYQDALVATPTKKSESDNYEEMSISFSKECSGMMDRLARQVRCCNRWSYTYIGMYGYSFAQGGEKAIQLFETREWMDIVRDNLIQNILLMASIVIGGSTGTFAVLVEEVDGYTFTSLHQPVATAFWIGSILGFVLSNILLLGVVGSAVNTILVCFAADPFEFDKNHPRLSREMREVWSQQVWEPTDETV